jgi:hypothetical protein
MASIRKDIDVGVTATDAWEALRDYGAVHERIAPGFVVDSRTEGQDRIVTFVSGAVARERLVTLDDEARRLVYSVIDGPLGATHHQASVEVVDPAEGVAGCRLVWITDLLPDELGPTVDGLMEQAAVAMTRALAADHLDG